MSGFELTLHDGESPFNAYTRFEKAYAHAATWKRFIDAFFCSLFATLSLDESQRFIAKVSRDDITKPFSNAVTSFVDHSEILITSGAILNDIYSTAPETIANYQITSTRQGLNLESVVIALDTMDSSGVSYIFGPNPNKGLYSAMLRYITSVWTDSLYFWKTDLETIDDAGKVVSSKSLPCKVTYDEDSKLFSLEPQIEFKLKPNFVANVVKGSVQEIITTTMKEAIIAQHLRDTAYINVIKKGIISTASKEEFNTSIGFNVKRIFDMIGEYEFCHADPLCTIKWRELLNDLTFTYYHSKLAQWCVDAGLDVLNETITNPADFNAYGWKAKLIHNNGFVVAGEFTQ